MAISCPNCGTEANVKGDARRVGKLVRCRKCGTAWFARIVEDDPFARRESALAADAQGISDAIVIEDPVPGFDRSRPIDPDSAAQRPLLLAVATTLPAKVSAVAVILALAFVVLRAPLVAALPQLSAGIGTAGIELRGIKIETISVGGNRTLIVEGEIVNTRITPVDLPLVQIALKGNDGTEILAWHTQPVAHLAAGQSIGFRSARVAPPQSGSQVTVSFAD